MKLAHALLIMLFTSTLLHAMQTDIMPHLFYNLPADTNHHILSYIMPNSVD